MAPEIEISTDASRLDVALIYDFIRKSYWGIGRSRAVVERSIQHSLCFGAYESGRQVGFGRVITDYAIFAYLADFFVIPECQRRGIGRALVRAVVEHPQLKDLQVMLLRTRYAHGLYDQFGFMPLPRPEEMVVRYH